jgi:hypothetical protein
MITALVNFGICVAIGWVCICRLNATVSRDYRRVRARYTLLLGGACASGCAPVLFNAPPSPGTAIFALTVLVGLLINVPRWTGRRKGDKCSP